MTGNLGAAYKAAIMEARFQAVAIVDMIDRLECIEPTWENVGSVGCLADDLEDMTRALSVLLPEEK